MRITIVQATTPEDMAAMLSIRRTVFEDEMNIKLNPLQPSENGQVTYLVARAGPTQEPVGCLCVLDTTNNHQLHEELGLEFDPQARVARYTHLAVLKSYRGMNIPLAMMVEAHRSAIVRADSTTPGFCLTSREPQAHSSRDSSASPCCQKLLCLNTDVDVRCCATSALPKLNSLSGRPNCI